MFQKGKKKVLQFRFCLNLVNFGYYFNNKLLNIKSFSIYFLY